MHHKVSAKQPGTEPQLRSLVCLKVGSAIADAISHNSEACGKFQSGMQYQNMSTKADPYAYCSVWPVNDEVHVEQCNLCLQAGGQEYLANCKQPIP
jgi:hypothetical protein